MEYIITYYYIHYSERHRRSESSGLVGVKATFSVPVSDLPLTTIKSSTLLKNFFLNLTTDLKDVLHTTMRLHQNH